VGGQGLYDQSAVSDRELIIGMDGFIGRALCRHLPDALKTTRRGQRGLEPIEHHFDLLQPGWVPPADIVYLCAGVNGTLSCAQDPQRSYRTNVDGTIFVAEYCRDHAFLVWISSTTVEWLGEHYGEQKRIAENYLRALPHVGIVRAGRVLQSNVAELCSLMVEVGRQRRRGIVLWNEDERPYQH
jgi:nucleoside-diphosphate-sugar epimerase